MIALYRYVAAGVLHRQLYLPPVLLFAVVVAVGSRGDGGPLLPLYALWVGAMLPCSVWLTVAVLATEDAVQERITRVNARRMWFPLVAGALVALTFGILVETLRQAGRMAVAMDARGFSASVTSARPRTWAEPAPWHTSDSLMLALGLVVSAMPVLVSRL